MVLKILLTRRLVMLYVKMIYYCNVMVYFTVENFIRNFIKTNNFDDINAVVLQMSFLFASTPIFGKIVTKMYYLCLLNFYNFGKLLIIVKTRRCFSRHTS